MVEMSGSQALIEALYKEKVEVIFGLPGGAIIPVYDVLLDSKIRHILGRHEQSVAHMAEGFARASGRVGVCMATSGPGATNLVTGIANAYMDSSSVVAITGQVPTSMIGRDAFQEVDIIGITTPITKHNFQPKYASEIPKTVKMAFHIASTGRPGPVLIDIPKDVQNQTADMVFPNKVEIQGYNPNISPHPLQVKKAIDLLTKAEKPIIMAGGGVILSNTSQKLQVIVELLLAPVITTLMSKGCFPENHPLSLGVLGMHGSAEANKLISEADVILAAGVRFSDRTTGKIDEFCPDAKIIHIDIDPSEIGKNKAIDVPIVGDLSKTFDMLYDSLAKRLEKREDSPWLKKVRQTREEFKGIIIDQGKGLSPPKLLKKLRELLPNNSVITTEVGQNQMWASLYFKVFEPRTFISSGGLGTMGFGFPAAIGAKVARPDVPVIDIAGDGSFGMTANSLATSVVEKIPVIVVILNNSMLGMVAQWQRLFYNRRYSAVELGVAPDFVKLAEAFGAQGFRIGSIDEFTKVVKGALKSEVTTVIDVPISPEENVFPMVPAGKGLRDTVYG
ncbi:MAG: biosynthetic-type acetolactate synthase large subunit [Candidatus Methylarchaceae archaeon HK02M1]|nr:biosynthetic-type acetolactate synthase large subunit [Candidatus Methylarchaceae archaeon HK02M1]